jgi:hypothetical protein
VEQLIALNSAAYFHENVKTAFPFDATDFNGVKGDPARRIQYFANDWLNNPRGSRSKQKKK